MTETKYIVKTTTQFKRDYKLAVKRGLKIDLLKDIVAALAMGEKLPEKNKDHALTGNWVGHRECHILPDWLLIYRIEDDVLVLTLARTSSHIDLFCFADVFYNSCLCGGCRITPFADFTIVAAGVVGAYFGAVGAIPGGVSSAYWWLLASRLDANNHGHGVYVEMTWVLVFDITPQ